MSVLRYKDSQDKQGLTTRLRESNPQLNDGQLSELKQTAYLDVIKGPNSREERLYTGLYVIEEKAIEGALLLPPRLSRTDLGTKYGIEDSWGFAWAESQSSLWPFFPEVDAIVGAQAMQALVAYGPQYAMTAQHLSIIKSRLSRAAQSSHRHFILHYYTLSGEFTTSITGLSRKKRKELYGTKQED